MPAIHAIPCTRCHALLQAPCIARFPRCNFCGEQLTCGAIVPTSAEEELRVLQEWVGVLTVRFDQLVLDLRWARERWEEAAAAQQPWHEQLKSLVYEFGWIAMWTWGLWDMPYLLASFAIFQLLLNLWSGRRRSRLPVVDEAAEHAMRRRRVMDQEARS